MLIVMDRVLVDTELEYFLYLDCKVFMIVFDVLKHSMN